MKYLIVLVISFMFASQSYAEGESSGSKGYITTNLGFNMARVKEIADTGFGFMLGGKYNYLLNEKIAAFIGAEYMQRNTSENDVDVELTSIDIPFGIAFSYNNRMFDAASTTYLGLYYNMFQDGSIGDIEVEGEDHLGFLFQTDTFFALNENIDLGYFVQLKFGFGDAIEKVGPLAEGTKNNTLDFAIGLAMKF